MVGALIRMVCDPRTAARRISRASTRSHRRRTAWSVRVARDFYQPATLPSWGLARRNIRAGADL